MEQETRPLSRSKPHPLSEPLTEESRIELLTETLVLWHGLEGAECVERKRTSEARPSDTRR
jgi:hypothetical protein